MLANITVPGTIPGLLRRGSPIVLLTEYLDSYFRAPAGSGGVVSFKNDERAWVALTASGTREDAFLEVAALDCIALDLTDATGRAHASWWLARQQPSYHWPRHQPIETVAFLAGSYGWCLAGMSESHRGWGYPGKVGQHVGILPPKLPCLDGLDPRDPRTLNDGSRLVDVEALRRVVLHTAHIPEVPSV